jgi:hypothetical protein
VTNAPSLPDPERTSQRLLVKMEGHRIPVDVHGVTKVWAGLSIVEEEIDGPGYLLPLGKIGGEIIVRGRDPIERKRFTIAHEVGHWVLGMTCERKAGEFRQPAGIRRDVIEKWCDAFAASFLVPRQMLIDHFRGVHGALLVTHLGAAPKQFRVSDEAMFLRVYEVLGMRVAYFDVRTKKITRAFVPDTAVADLERMLASPEVSDYLYLDALALTTRVGSAKFVCSWRGARKSGSALLVLAPCT